MKISIRSIAILILAIVFAANLSAQNKTEQAKTYFAGCTSTKAMMELIAKSLPSSEECALIFSGENADTYYKMVEEVRVKLATEEVKNNETFADQSFETFTTEDVKQGKGNYAGGMKNIEDKLQAGVIFYEVELLRSKGAESGVAYKYWVYVNNRWIFLPKPWSAFKKG